MKLMVLFIIICASLGQNVINPDRQCLVDKPLFSEVQLLKCELRRVKHELAQTKEACVTMEEFNAAVEDSKAQIAALTSMMTHNLSHNLSYVNQAPPSDCSEIKKVNAASESGIYSIRHSNGSSLQVYCDMTTDGGGWLVFQRRQDGSENFYRNWEDYQHGFGKLDGEFWLGNDVLASITNQTSYELRVDLMDYQGVKAYAVYDLFSIDAMDEYRLTLGEYNSNGTAGDSLTYHKGQKFSTFDKDNDSSSWNCANFYKGAWWYRNCQYSNLNGRYAEGIDAKCVRWHAFREDSSLKFTEMKIRQTY